MRLGKIKQVCKAARQVYILTADGTVNNMVVQWIGTARALYPVVGLNLTLQTLVVLWEMMDKAADLDMAEGTFSDMVDRGLLNEADAELLRNVTASVNTSDMPLLGLGEINGYKALACGEKELLFIQDWMLAPCYKQGSVHFDIVKGDGRRVAVYGRDSIVGLLWPVEAPSAEALAGILRGMAERTVYGT